MRFQWVLPLLGLAVGPVTARTPAESRQLMQGLHEGPLGSRPVDYVAQEEPMVKRTDSKHRFLTENSAKFAVDGKNIPEVGFDAGESYSGLLPISGKENETDNLFFWFFPTVNEEFKNKKEITIWLNGGPGCPSLVGLLQENGPFLWQPGTLNPQKNPWSWHLLTNIVWVDQPVTVGYSTGNVTIENEDDLAKQFMGFWKNFVETFAMQGYKVYIAAESYGGYYGPFISSHFLNAKDTKYYDLGGLMVVDGQTFDGVVQHDLIAESYLDTNRNLIPLDDHATDYIRKSSEKCGYRDFITKSLTFPPAGAQPRYPPGVNVYPNGRYFDEDGYVNYKPDCELENYLIEQAGYQNPCFNFYSINDHCPPVYNPLGVNPPYFDRADVKKALHAPAYKEWQQCQESVFKGQDMSDPPSNYELPNVIEKTNNVILVQGSLDSLLPLNGVLLGIQNMTWNGKMGFQTRPQDLFYVPRYGYNPNDGSSNWYAKSLPAGSGVVGTTHQERGLILAVTQLAGHEGPQFAPAAAFRQLEKLLGRVKSLQDTEPFTLPELKGIKQDSKSLGKGTVPIPCIKAGC